MTRYLQISVLLVLLCYQSALGASWQLNPSIPGVTNLGTLISSCVQEHQQYFVNTNGDKHFLLWYYGGSEDNLLDVNLTQGTARRTSTWAGRGGIAGYAYSNGIVYRAINDAFYSNSVMNGVLISYDVASGNISTISATYDYGGYYMDWGDDGRLYMGSYGYNSGASLERYDPTTRVFESLGLVDTNRSFPSGGQYAHTLGADTRFCYVALRTGQKWYLGVWDSVTGMKTNMWYPGDGTSYIYRGKHGGWYYDRKGDGTAEIGTSHVWYSLSNGVANLIGTNATFYTNVLSHVDSSTDHWRANMVNDAPIFTNDTGFEFELGYAYPDSSNNVSTVGWSTNGSGIWNYASASNFSLSPANLGRIYPNGTNLMILCYLYGPWLDYNPPTRSVRRYGQMPNEVYSAIHRGDVWYITGYNAVTISFNPSLPWTFSPATPNKGDPSVNPHYLSLAMVRSELYSAIGSDGMLYVASWVSRTGAGTKFGWYDPTHDTSYSYWPFTDNANAPSDLVAVMGGTKLVFLPYGNNNLYVFDVASKSFTATNSLILPELTTLDKCLEVANGIVVGVSGNRVWQYNVATDTVLSTNTLPGAAWIGGVVTHAVTQSNHRLGLGPDGYVWLTLGNDLYRIHPATCATELVKTNVGMHDVVFNGGDAYLYYPSSPELHVLQNLLIECTSNGVPVWWLEQYGLAMDGSADFVDSDADGRNNWAEWRCGTVPTNSASVLRFDEALLGSFGPVVRWQSVAGKSYRLDRSTNLVTDHFLFNVRSNIPASPPLNTETDTTAVGSSAFYYRVQLE